MTLHWEGRREGKRGREGRKERGREGARGERKLGGRRRRLPSALVSGWQEDWAAPDHHWRKSTPTFYEWGGGVLVVRGGAVRLGTSPLPAKTHM